LGEAFAGSAMVNEAGTHGNCGALGTVGNLTDSGQWASDVECC
jgi:hypothetical protein